MASLTEVYEGHLRTVTTSRRFYAGASLFAVGAAMVVGSIAVSTTTAGASLGLDRIAARMLAGTLAGLGLPATFLGVFAVLPSGRTTRAAAVIGASVSVLGVALFRVAYPDQWFGAGDPLAIATVVVYFFGAMTTLSCLFAGLATFKTRNDPGGTARMEITESGNVRLVEDAEPAGGLGSVGFLGNDPQGEVRTQTNREDQPSPEETRSGHDAEILSGPGEGPAPTADGGSATVDDRTDAEFIETANQRGRPDAYCGNCAHFEYVKIDEKITPYCGLHDELMEDMDACDQWSEAD
ncbi:tripartite tricarboxylate transporter TctB family protein [Halosimplex sp. TS25]|uniref:tripartite tricarboxylate transporter TctB family protein n=1 Tax=Halosimplex rarum TaxID=3396619 RepID=UPI0039EAC8FD